mmetsp:Transcript_11485/g.33115  ORF Transcript_11485/g.33115 Transcript_11485/m.33115 type:complete len:233 (+) Transcript_11485:1207-1905(+)
MQHAGNDHACRGASTTELAVEDETCLVVRFPEILQELVEVLLLWCLFVREWDTAELDWDSSLAQILEHLGHSLDAVRSAGLPVRVQLSTSSNLGDRGHGLSMEKQASVAGRSLLEDLLLESGLLLIQLLSADAELLEILKWSRTHLEHIRTAVDINHRLLSEVEPEDASDAILGGLDDALDDGGVAILRGLATSKDRQPVHLAKVGCSIQLLLKVLVPHRRKVVAFQDVLVS